MVAKGGAPLLAADAVEAVASLLVPGAGLLTPNAPEAERLAGVAVETLDGQRRAGERLLRRGAKAVLVKGGHVAGDRITDLLATEEGELFFESPRIDTASTHGTGCTLASAIAARLALGEALPDAVERARAYVAEAIRTAPGFGKGHGPLNHGWPLQRA
jgi:hydroxymethylpyrimidine/phosphomethylpyrimidine kinase